MSEPAFRYPTAAELFAVQDLLPVTVKPGVYFDFFGQEVERDREDPDNCTACAITSMWLLLGNAGMTEQERLRKLFATLRDYRAAVHEHDAEARSALDEEVATYEGAGMAERLEVLGFDPAWVAGLEAGFENSSLSWHYRHRYRPEGEALFLAGNKVGAELRAMVFTQEEE